MRALARALRRRWTRHPARRGGTSATRPPERQDPLVSVVLLDGDTDSAAAAVAAVLQQSYASVEVLAPHGALVGPTGDTDDRVRQLPPGVDPVREATGDLLMFLRPDERLRPGALERLVDRLTGSGADVVVGVGVGGPEESPWCVAMATDGDVVGSDRGPDVLLDVGLTNRMFDATHWRSVAAGGGWASPAAAAATAARAAVEATAVALVPEQLLEAGEEDAEQPLRGRRRYRPDPLRERLTALADVAVLLEGSARDDFLVALAGELLPRTYVDAVAGGDPYFQVLQPHARAVLEELGDRRSRLPVAARMGGYVAAYGSWLDNATMQELLVDAPSGLPHDEASAEGTPQQTVASPASLAVDVPAEWRRVEEVDRRLRSRVRLVRRAGDGLEVEGAAFVEYAATATPVVDVAAPGGPWERAGVIPNADPRWNDWAARTWEDRSDAGFVARVAAQIAGPPTGNPAEVSVRVSVGPRAEVHACTVASDAVEGDRLDAATLTGLELEVGGVCATRLASALLRGPKGVTEPAAVRQGDDGRLTVALRTTTEHFGTRVPLPSGRYALELRGADGAVVAVPWSRRVLDDPPELVGSRAGLTPVAVRDGAGVVVGAPLAADGESAYRQQRWATAVFVPSRPHDTGTVLLETFHGRSVGDNPGPIGAELARRSGARLPQLDLVWVVDDPSIVVPDGCRAVVRHTRDWYEELGRARVYVTNAAAPRFYRKPPGQLLLQTWHGTPLKRLAADRGPGDLATWSHRRTVEGQARSWDALLSPGPFTSEVLSAAFRYPGPVLASGYPRNDVLLSTERDTVRGRVRRLLGVGPDDRVVLYAPTWRDYAGAREAKPLYLDAALLTRTMPETVVLVRGHYNASKQRDVLRRQPRVLDVTRYPDIAELLLACDVLVTDYSSVMFDFAVTGKPMALLVPDLERYRRFERGFYLDLEELAPGPLLTSTEGLVEALGDSLGDSLTGQPDRDRFSSARRAFRDRFCPWEDGNAAVRVVDHLAARVGGWH